MLLFGAQIGRFADLAPVPDDPKAWFAAWTFGRWGEVLESGDMPSP